MLSSTNNVLSYIVAEELDAHKLLKVKCWLPVLVTIFICDGLPNSPGHWAVDLVVGDSAML